jgi:hypothetical protein
MVSKIECICDYLEEIDEFFSITEFERFEKYIKKLLEDGELVEVEVLEKYLNFEQHWFECSVCKQKWRLVYPDFPFKGFWMKYDS